MSQSIWTTKNRLRGCYAQPMKDVRKKLGVGRMAYPTIDEARKVLLGERGKCVYCGGSGYIKTESGETPYCACRILTSVDRSINRMRALSRDVPPLRFDGDMPNARDIRIAFGTFIKHPASGIIFGPPGTGKTTFMRLLLEAFSPMAVYVTEDALLQHDNAEALKSAPAILLIDDIGATVYTENSAWRTNNLRRVIGARADSGYITLVGTNMRADALRRRVGERVYSRLMQKKKFSAKFTTKVR